MEATSNSHNSAWLPVDHTCNIHDCLRCHTGMHVPYGTT